MAADGLLAAAVLALLQAGGAPDAPPLEPCEIEGVPGPVRCGSVRVPEVRGAGDGRSIELRVVVAGATGDEPETDPVFFLPGGPGAGATGAADRTAERWRRVRLKRDLVFVDPRGTGGSAPLGCAVDDPRVFLGSVFPLEVVRRCRRRLEGRAALEAYHTVAVARDLEAVRAALGYGRVNLRGVSFGTRLALTYLALHPDRVRALVLDGVTQLRPGGSTTFGPDLEQALGRLFDDCANDEGCSRSHPDPAGDLAAVLATLADSGVVVPVDGEAGAGDDPVRFSRGDFVYSLRGMMYGPSAVTVPALLRRAAADGDLEPFAAAYLRRARAVWSGLQMGQHLSVFCREDVPERAAGVGEDGVRSGGLGRELEADYRAACRAWGVPAVAPEPWMTRTRSTPALVLSGRRDPVTPPGRAAQAVAHLLRTRHVVFPFGGHGWSGGDDHGCRAELVRRFLERPDPDALDTSCVAGVRPEPFAVIGK